MNPELFETEVEVKTISDCKVITDPVIFHPDEGGQPADTGSIEKANVNKVEILPIQPVIDLMPGIPLISSVAPLIGAVTLGAFIINPGKKSAVKNSIAPADCISGRAPAIRF